MQIDNNYTLDMFKKDLKYIVKHDDVSIDEVYTDNGEYLPINNSAVKSSWIRILVF